MARQEFGREGLFIGAACLSFWGQLYLNKSHTLIYFENDVSLAVDEAYELGFSRVYFVWWNEPIGWYGITVPEDFVLLKDFGRISVYAHVQKSFGYWWSWIYWKSSSHLAGLR